MNDYCNGVDTGCKMTLEWLVKVIGRNEFSVDNIKSMCELRLEDMNNQYEADAKADKTPPEVKAAQAIAKAETDKAAMKQQSDAQANQLKMQELQAKVQQEQQQLELDRQKQELDSAKELLKIQQDRAKLEADIQLREIDLKIKQEAQEDKANDSDMKTMVSAIDKISKING